MTLQEAIAKIRPPVVVLRAMQPKYGHLLPSDLDILIDASHNFDEPRLMQWAQMFVSLAVAPLRGRTGPPLGRVFLYDGYHMCGIELTDGDEARRVRAEIP